MKPLTLEYAIENKFTAQDCIKYFDKTIKDDACEVILWEFTCYPMSNEMMIKQLNEYFKRPTKTN